eukprot:4761225-Prymnesium_polylepis.1
MADVYLALSGRRAARSCSALQLSRLPLSSSALYCIAIGMAKVAAALRELLNLVEVGRDGGPHSQPIHPHVARAPHHALRVAAADSARASARVAG